MSEPHGMHHRRARRFTRAAALLCAVLGLIAGGNAALPSARASGTTTITAGSANMTLPSASTASSTVTASLDAADAGVNAFDITLTFNPAIATVSSVDPAGAWNFIPPPVIDNGAGTVRVIAVMLAAGCSGTCPLFTINWNAVDEGTSPVQLAGNSNTVLARTGVFVTSGFAPGTVTVGRQAGTRWYFAEGWTGNGWETYTYLLNANALAANVTVTYFRETGGPVVKNVVVPAQSRTTLFANNPAEGPGPNVAFGMTIDASVPITASQSLVDTVGQLAHGTVGSQKLSSQWYFAEGFTGNSWLTFISTTNPGSTSASVTVTYHKDDATSVSVTHTVPAHARVTFAGHDDVPNSTFSVSVSSTVPIVSQEVLIDVPGLLAHGTIGVTAPGTLWNLSEGFTGDSWLTFISVGNFGAGPATVTATYNLLGEAPVTRIITVPAGARGTFAGHELATGVGPGKSFGVTVTSTAPIVVQEVLIDPKIGVRLAHAVMASPSLGTAFSFAGGTSDPGWLTFISVMNPSLSAGSVSATYYFDDGTAPITRTQGLPAQSRVTFASYDVPTGVPAGKRFGVRIVSTVPMISQEVVINTNPGTYYAYSAAGTAGP